MHPTALIAEDEPLLAAHLKQTLATLWPELEVLATVAHGQAAVDESLARRPQVLFLDVRMPGLSGLEAAEALAEQWPADQPLPRIAFVTAYDEYALKAFDLAAVDYVLKPVNAQRLAQTCERMKAALAAPAASADGASPRVDTTLQQLRALLGGGLPREPAVAKLAVIQASVGSAIHLVPVGDVVYFEAADKYVRVVTAAREYLIRVSLRELLPQLDAEQFWQVHRGTVVRAEAIATAQRDEAGKLTLTLRDHADRLPVSRVYAHRFKAM